LPDILKSQSDEPDPSEWVAIEESINEAIEQVENFRKSEGSHLFKDISFTGKNHTRSA
jgi:uncharacterized protein YicC (UPF0701 family)